ncbi:MAG TPA: bifunctional precorrin-2 dehydrogenase/sirohydrochlorin ferrochelatase [Dehalococcoidia bacterium]|nr:bifunctional precorrin-2 dehydrogenase/sirohydrochlorin ferrochelatase [Dehalococcoidia bacterium]
MSARYYPIFLDLKDRPAVIIGGGEVAWRKAQGLLEAGAAITVISPALHPELAALKGSGSLHHLEREYRAGDLSGFLLAFVATNDHDLNRTVAEEGKQLGVLVNAVDDPPNCDFVMPSIIRRGDLTLAISTGGGSPAAARRVREDMEAFLTEDYALLLDLATEVRRELRERDVSVDAETWNRALDEELRSLLASGQRHQAKDRLLAALTGGAR